MKNIIITIFMVFCILMNGCDNDILNNENGDIINNGSENDDNNGNENDNGNENNVVNDQINILKGTIWYADRGNLFIEFPDNHLNLILFKNYQYYGSIGGNLNGNVTLGNFQMTSYDGKTIKLLDYDKKEVSFTAIISENKMTVSGLNTIKLFPYPYQRRDFRSYNQVYTKGE